MRISKFIERLKNKRNKKLNFDPQKMPKHIALIMDGNGRWAQKKGLPRTMGHRAGVQALKRTITYAKELGIDIITVYAFSTENWSRPQEEVQALLELLIEHLTKDLKEIKENNVRLNFIGRINELPAKIRKLIEEAEEETNKNDGLILNIALNYGGRTEIVDAAIKIVENIEKGKMTKEEITEETFAKFLYTADIGYPDLLIRFSGEERISNFLLWQIAYSELYFCSALWPDIKKTHLIEAITDYQKRDRRFGGIKV